MRFVATHPDVAEAATIDTDDLESARSIAAEQFAHTLDLSIAAVHCRTDVTALDVG